MKKLILLFLLLPSVASAAWYNPLSWFQSGVKLTAAPPTYMTDAIISNLGGSGTLCVQTDNNGKLTKAAAACGTGSGGGGADGNWTFFNGSGIRLATTSNQVRLGGTSTTTNSKLEITGGISFDFATGTKATTTNFAISSILSSLLKTNGTGGVVAASAGTDYEVPLTFGDGLTRTLNDVDVDTTQNIAKLSNLTSNGFVKTSGGDGTLSVDTTTYESGLTAGDGLTRTTNDFDCDTASGTVFGCLTSADWTTFNNKQGTISAAWPITLSGATVGFNGLSTSSAAVIGNIPYFSGVNTFANVATTSLTANSPLSLSQPVTVIGSAASALSLSTAGDWTGTFDGQEGTYYLARANHTGTQAASTITGDTFGAGSFVFPSGSLTSLGSTTLQDFTANTATTTNLIVAGITGSTQCLRVNSLGQVSGSGADCGTGSGGAYPFGGTGNSTSTLTQFNAGLTAYASSTIGNGTGAGGLTVNGTATTTSLTIKGITGSTQCLHVDALGQVTGTGSDCGSGGSVNGTLGQVAYLQGTNNAIGTSTISIDTTSFVGIGSTTPNTKLSVALEDIRTTPTGAIMISNDTPATASVQSQYSPSLMFHSAAWRTSNSTNNPFDWRIFSTANQGSTPDAALQIQVQANNGGYNTTAFSLSSGSTLSIGANIYAGATSQIGFSGRSTFQSPSNGIITATNAAASDLTRFNFGNTTSSFPALTRSNANLIVTSADGSLGSSFGVATTSAWARLSVTNTTAGPSFIVEDTTSPDTTPFIIDANGNVGVATTTPATELDVNGLIRVYQTATTTCSASIEGAIFYNGTAGNKHFYGCDGTTWKQLDN